MRWWDRWEGPVAAWLLAATLGGLGGLLGDAMSLSLGGSVLLAMAAGAPFGVLALKDGGVER